MTFTDQDDVVPASGVEQILNTGIANTLAGNYTINGRNKHKSITFNGYSFRNYGILNTCEGNDILTGTFNDPDSDSSWIVGIYNEIGTIDTGDGNDTITGIIEKAGPRDAYAIFTAKSTIDTGDGNDTITGITPRGTGIFSRDSTINTGDGNDIISGLIEEAGPRDAYAIFTTKSTIDTGDGNDTITDITPRGTGIFSRDSTIAILNHL